MACNYMGEACSGGQSIFNGLWAQTASFVDE